MRYRDDGGEPGEDDQPQHADHHARLLLVECINIKFRIGHCSHNLFIHISLFYYESEIMLTQVPNIVVPCH